MKKKLSDIALVLIFVTGLSLLLYPSLANWWNQQHATTAIADYTSTMANTGALDMEAMLNSALAYNVKLAEQGNSFSQPTPEETEEYKRQLSADSAGMMGSLSIPKIRVNLPIYHGTEDSVLSVGVGHLEGTSLPIGGKSTHTVLSGHRGMPSARLLTDLDQLNVGDEFTLDVYGDTLTYQVDQILVVLPEDVTALCIYPGFDFCTLVTCTPYGINSHRLLVRGARIKTTSTVSLRVPADAIQIEPVRVALALAVPVLLGLLLWLLVAPVKKKGKKA